MLQDRVQMTRALVELWNTRGRGVERAHELVDPTIELESPLSSVAGEPYRGYAGIERWVRDLEEQFVEWSIAVDDVREIAGQVIAVVTVQARGRASDVPLQFSAASLHTFAPDNRVTRVRIYRDVSEALEAVESGEVAVSQSVEVVRRSLGLKD
jgi:SnoaL-like domain